MTIIAYFVFKYLGAPFYGALINIPSMLTVLLLFSAIAALTSDLLWYAGNRYDHASANTPRGDKGQAAFVQSLEELSHELATNWAPYWGSFGGFPLLIDFASNALVLGPAGVGKGIKNLIISIWCNRHSKTIFDFKGELAVMLVRVLRKQGQVCRTLNIGNVFTDILGPSDHYNPLCVLYDSFVRPGGLRDIVDDVDTMCQQLVPEPGGNDDVSENTYWRDGSRDFLIFAILMCLLIGGQTATLGEVARLLSSHKELLRHAQWACGQLRAASSSDEDQFMTMPIKDSPWVSLHDAEDVENFIDFMHALATTVVELLESTDTKNSGPFLTGARQGVRSYNSTTRAFEATSKTTMRFAEQKESEKPVNIFIIVDASRLDAQKKVVALIQWCMLLEYKRSPNFKRPVYIYADEATNFFLHSLGSLLTWGRAFGIRFIFYIQSLSAFRKVYGPDVLATLESETEIKLYLSGQREADTLEMIERSLGQESYIAVGRSGSTEAKDYWINGTSFNEDGKPVQDQDQIRRSYKGILFVRNNRAIEVDLPVVGAVAPVRDEIDINPYHGSPFLLPVTLTIALDKLYKASQRHPLWRSRIRKFGAQKAHLTKMARRCWFLSRLVSLWPILALLVFFVSPSGPHLAVSYQGHWCTYLGSRGLVEVDNGPECPLLAILNKGSRL